MRHVLSSFFFSDENTLEVAPDFCAVPLGGQRLLPFWQKRFQLHTQCISDPVDVIEIADDLYRIVDSAIIETVLPQLI